MPSFVKKTLVLFCQKGRACCVNRFVRNEQSPTQQLPSLGTQYGGGGVGVGVAGFRKLGLGVACLGAAFLRTNSLATNAILGST